MASPPQPPARGGNRAPLPRYAGGDTGGGPVVQPPSRTPLILSVIAIVCWYLFAPAAIMLGLIAQRQYRKQGRRDTLAKVAWIGGIVVLALYILLLILHHRVTHTTPTG